MMTKTLTMEEFAEVHGITATYRQVHWVPQKRLKDYPGGDHHRVILHYGDKSMVVPMYSRGRAHIGKPITAGEVLGCLQCDFIQGETYESWVSDYGLDDSLASRRMYESCLRETKLVTEFLGELLAEFLEAEY